MDYITCERRKNSPKLNVLICEKKCEYAEACKTYLNYLKEKSRKAPMGECTSEADEILVVKSTKESPLITVSK